MENYIESKSWDWIVVFIFSEALSRLCSLAFRFLQTTGQHATN